jgi:hypothetical protein
MITNTSKNQFDHIDFIQFFYRSIALNLINCIRGNPTSSDLGEKMNNITQGNLHMEGKMTVVFNDKPAKEISCHVVILTNGTYKISKDKKHITIFSAEHFRWNSDSYSGSQSFSSNDFCSPVTISSK